MAPSVTRLATLAVAFYALIICVMLFAQSYLVLPGQLMGSSDLARLLHQTKGRVTIKQLHREGASHKHPVLPFRAALGMPASGKPKCGVLYFGGNAETITSCALRALDFSAYGCIAVAVEPPGFGDAGVSAGPATRETMHAAADVAAEYMHELVAEHDTIDTVVVVGASVGTFLAARVSAAGLGSALLLQAPLTSMVAVASRLCT
jgi:alpha-beta hydrolase superfamily lysophospholipase